MDNNKRWALEEAHDKAVREFNEADEILSDFRDQFYRNTSHLADYVSSFYRDLPDISLQSISNQFDQTFQEYNWEIRKKQQEIEGAREEERRQFNWKMEE
jgi:hypothetical protein